MHDNIGLQSKGDHWTDRVTISGYGELYYNNLTNKPGKADAGNEHKIDLHRFVLFIGFHFNDRLRMYSDLEQAYIEYNLLNKPMYGITQSSIRDGLFLIHGQLIANLAFAKTQIF